MGSASQPRAIALRMRTSRLLIAVGSIGLALAVGVRVDSALGARRARTEFEAQLTSVKTFDPDTRDWSTTRRAEWEASRAAPTGAPVGRLSIPALGLEVMVLDGTDELSLNRGVGRIEGTRIESNLGIAGHRDGFFRALRNVAERDLITLETPDSSYTYQVRSLSVVSPEDVQVLAPTPEPSLTLVTCHPFFVIGHAPNRFIVHAARVDAPRSDSSEGARHPPGFSTGPRIAAPGALGDRHRTESGFDRRRQ